MHLRPNAAQLPSLAHHLALLFYPGSSTYDPDGGRVVGLKDLDRNLEVRGWLLGGAGGMCKSTAASRLEERVHEHLRSAHVRL